MFRLFLLRQQLGDWCSVGNVESLIILQVLHHLVDIDHVVLVWGLLDKPTDILINITFIGCSITTLVHIVRFILQIFIVSFRFSIGGWTEVLLIVRMLVLINVLVRLEICLRSLHHLIWQNHVLIQVCSISVLVHAVHGSTVTDFVASVRDVVRSHRSYGSWCDLVLKVFVHALEG